MVELLWITPSVARTRIIAARSTQFVIIKLDRLFQWTIIPATTVLRRYSIHCKSNTVEINMVKIKCEEKNLKNGSFLKVV